MAREYNNQSKLEVFFTKWWTWVQLLKTRFVWFFVRNRKHPVKVYKNIAEIPVALSWGTRYKPDPIGRNPILHPTEIQKRIEKDELIADCEDHACYWAAALIKSKLAKKVWMGVFWYYRADGTFGGHAVCVFLGLDGKMYYADYGMPVENIAPIAGPDAFGWLSSAFPAYGKKLVSASMTSFRGLNKRDTLKFGKTLYFKPDKIMSVTDLLLSDVE